MMRMMRMMGDDKHDEEYGVHDRHDVVDWVVGW
jgi:hypothetical protein